MTATSIWQSNVNRLAITMRQRRVHPCGNAIPTSPTTIASKLRSMSTVIIRRGGGWRLTIVAGQTIRASAIPPGTLIGILPPVAMGKRGTIEAAMPWEELVPPSGEFPVWLVTARRIVPHVGIAKWPAGATSDLRWNEAGHLIVEQFDSQTALGMLWLRREGQAIPAHPWGGARQLMVTYA